ncbi:MAG: hypothetical protein SOS24_03540 [Clostridia bacterium]|nr:hypothetical protein [Clostridia bacterium]
MTKDQEKNFLKTLNDKSFTKDLNFTYNNAEDRESYFRFEQQISINTEYDKERKIALGL